MINTIEQNGLSFEIDKSNFTLTIVSSTNAKGDIFIPRSIKFDSQEYLITRIGENSFENNFLINSIKFPENSEIKSIGKSSFKNSSLKIIYIPDKVRVIEDKAFKSCFLLYKVCISEESELTSIGKYAFFNCPTKKIFIPKKVTTFGEGCFYFKDNIEIKISPENKNISFLELNQKIFVCKSNPNNEEYDVILQSMESYGDIVIPSQIQYIYSYAFANSHFKVIENKKRLKTQVHRKICF